VSESDTEGSTGYLALYIITKPLIIASGFPEAGGQNNIQKGVAMKEGI
jgi:hypothetical protein